MAFRHYLPNQPKHHRSESISPEVWDSLHDLIEELWVKRNCTQKQVLEVLATMGHRPSPRQMTIQFRKWSMFKNQPRVNRKEIVFIHERPKSFHEHSHSSNHHFNVFDLTSETRNYISAIQNNGTSIFDLLSFSSSTDRSGSSTSRKPEEGVLDIEDERVLTEGPHRCQSPNTELDDLGRPTAPREQIRVISYDTWLDGGQIILRTQNENVSESASDRFDTNIVDTAPNTDRQEHSPRFQDRMDDDEMPWHGNEFPEFLIL